ncbi:hypothetical protein [Mycoplasmopsis adleri]|uniref:hypothetical protein n=1 Tax=Mycoplasmopsis adleri TaxID=51362 RepID=UPI003872D515
MRVTLGKLNKKLNISNVEVKKQNEIVADVKLSVPIELLKFIVVAFVSAFFVMLQYGNLTQNDLLREVYLYSIGLAFGDLTILILIGSWLSLIIRWISPWFKKHYLRWFYSYTRVDYWTFRKSLISFIWLNLLAIAIIYHSVLVFQRVDMSSTIIKPSEIGQIYTNGWYKSFTVDGKIANSNILPHAYLNVGVYADTIFNLMYVIAFSPYLAWFVALAIMAFSWLYLITIKPILYLKNLNRNKCTLPIIEKNIQRKISPFYYTNQVKTLFEFYRKAAKVLDIDPYKVKFAYLDKQIKKNINTLSNNSSLKEFFKIVAKRNSYNDDANSDFMKILRANKTKYNDSPDLLIASADPNPIIVEVQYPVSSYKTNEVSREYTLRDFDTREINSFNKNNIEKDVIYFGNKSAFQSEKEKDEEDTIPEIVEKTNINLQQQKTTELDQLIITETIDETIENKVVQAEQTNTQFVETIKAINDTQEILDEDSQKNNQLQDFNFLVDTAEATVETNIKEKTQTHNVLPSPEESQTNNKYEFLIDTAETEVNEQQPTISIQNNENVTSVINNPKAEINFEIDTIEVQEAVKKQGVNLAHINQGNTDNKTQMYTIVNDENKFTISTDNPISQDKKENTNTQKNFDFQFDSQVVILDENGQIDKNASQNNEDDDSWESPILSDKK